MSGEHPRDDEPDFLDDDFVLEEDAVSGDLPQRSGPAPAPRDGDLDELFEEPPARTGADEGLADIFASPRAADATAGAGEDADDALFAVDEGGERVEDQEGEILFTDHSQGLSPSQTFTGGGEFAEGRPSEWSGEDLELDREETEPADQPAILRGDEDDLVIDSDQDLVLVDGPSAAAEAPDHDLDLDLDLDEAHPGAAAAHGKDASAPSDDLPTLDPLDAEELELADEEAIHPDWAPLDEAGLDAEAEAPAGPAVEAWEPEAEDAEGHDLYVDEEQEAVATVVAAAPRRRTMGLLVSLAASLAILGTGATVAMRPEWFGLSLEVERVPSAQVTRPEIRVAVPPPALPALPEPTATPEVPPATTPEPVVTSPAEPLPPAPSTGPDTPQPAPSQPVVVPENTEPAPLPPTPTPTGLPADQEAVVAAEPVPPLEQAWPVPSVRDPDAPQVVRSGLVRLDDNVLLGEETGGPARRVVEPIEGMVPGSRAFAQLHNGNYFIGSVKAVDRSSLTLRMEEGEVTLPVAGIVRLTALGTKDYDELQKVTSGTIRLTNNNRLVGSILSGIADDHIVLEFRSNRVMLPKSAIGEVVAGQEQQDVRLDTTSEEDAWLRRLAARELGTGLGAPVEPLPKPQR